MHTDSLIQVEVTENNDDKTYGTAYLINKSCAITALHVIQNFKEIQFNFSNDLVINSVDEFEVTYEGDDCDMAIIRFTTADIDQLPNPELVKVGHRPQVDDRWYGAGYPKFAESQTGRPLEDVKGDCYRLREDIKQLELTCDKQAKVAQWGGISGAPVFSSGNDNLIAIITKHDQAVDNTHFKAVPLSVCFNDSEFASLFADPTRTERLNKETLFLLNKHSDLLEVFGKSCTTEIVNGLRPGEIEDFFEQADTLVQSVGPSVANQVILQCLPHFFVDQSVIIDKSILGQDVIDLDCVTEVSAECSMAAFAGRAANLSCSGGVDSQPYISSGSYALGPETGIDNPELDLQTLTAQLLESNSLDANIQPRLAKFAVGKSNVADYVNRKLNRDRAKGKYYYYIVSVNDSAPDSKELLEKIRRYKIAYPLLIFINLKQREDIPFEEGALYEFLPELITE